MKEFMNKLLRFVQWQRHEGQTWQIGARTITPQSQALIIRFPFGGFVWQRPVAVLVEEDGVSQRLPVVDVSRWALWSLAISTAVVGILVNRLSKRAARQIEQQDQVTQGDKE